MKKIFFATIISLVTVLCVSATVADSASSENYSSSVTATVAGMDEGIDFDTKTLVVIYNLMPQKVKDLCVASYKDIAPRIEKSSKSFTYEGVAITPIRTVNGTDLKFSCGGHSIVVKNYTKAEFDRIFGL
ncbi:MAG: hypothetical protein IJZ70_03540 [Bacteroidales bacterium]|nr:hypothetical protein [Bacteroidales bacterium]MBQ8811365.1 hypothetical protein [Bacteroidales bacterium]